MYNFIYRCPQSNLNVQGSVDNEEAKDKQYVSQVCLSCGRVHMVNPRTGKLMSEEIRSGDRG